MTFTFGSLFSGIGGIDLGLERAGMQCTWQVEKDAFCQKVLAKHWPNVARYGDVYTVGRDTLAGVDLIAGGFPCQPHSLAGERQASEDERDLWPQFYRIIRELKPRWVLGENVLGLLSSEDGRFFGTILRQLAEAGYDAEWCVLRASDVGAPHQRERVFIVAHANWFGESRQEGTSTNGQCGAPLSTSVCKWVDRTQMAYSGSQRPSLQRNRWNAGTYYSIGACSDYVAHPSSQRREEWDTAESIGDARLTTGRVETRPTSGQPQSRLGGMFDGLSTWMDRYRWPAGPGHAQHAWEPARVTTDKQPHRASRLKALGNAVVPQLAELIGRCILESEAAA
jgi:DNA (cytosine-5)-methyltransferase 1